MKKKLDFLGMGAVNVDIIHKKISQPFISKKVLEEISVHAGGSAGNTICALSKIGFNCGMIGRVGNDENTEMLLNDFKKYRVDISHITRNDSEVNGQAHSFLDIDEKRIIQIKPGANNTLTRKDINYDIFAFSNWIHYSSFIGEEQNSEQIKIAKELNHKVKSSIYIDQYIVNHGINSLKKIIPYIYTIFIRESLLIQLLGLNSKDGAKWFLKNGCQEVVIIRNNIESEIYTNEEHHLVEILNTSIIDSTGLSSAFIAGYLYGKIRKSHVKQSLLLGNTMMSFCGAKIGCRSNIPGIEELNKKSSILKLEKNILIIGGGGREHAIAWKLNQSHKVHRIYVAPGNAGISNIAQIVPILETDHNELIKFVKEKNIDLTIVGPEVPLSHGIVDKFEKQGMAIFGPSKKAAIIESSKIFAKEFMKKFNIPSALYEKFSESKKALKYLEKVTYPLVIKADGLASGKGVYICQNKKQAVKAIDNIMIKKMFGKSGNKVIIEEFLIGQEASILAFSDGFHIVPLLPAQDHKAVFDDDKGPNTGGMGAFAPAKIVTTELLNEIVETIIKPTIEGMRNIGRKYVGVIYAGIILTKEGPKVLEFNCRFGDPETQAIIPLLKSDFLEIIEATLLGSLEEYKIKWHNKFCTCVIISSKGYPSKYKVGNEITFHNKIVNHNDLAVFHSGTKSKTFTSGGRVLGIFSTGNNLKEAIDNSYNKVKKVHFKNMHHRTDIGDKGLKNSI